MYQQFLGMDPGQCGAIVLIEPDGKTIARWWTWNAAKHYYRLKNNATTDRPVGSLFDVSKIIAKQITSLPLFTLEGLFEPKPGRGKRILAGSAIKCAEAAGEMLGPLRERVAPVILRPTAAGPFGWRRNVLRLPDNTDADKAESYAVAVCERLAIWPEKGRALGRADERDVTLTKAEEGALAEAFAMARYGILSLQKPALAENGAAQKKRDRLRLKVEKNSPKVTVAVDD